MRLLVTISLVVLLLVFLSALFPTKTNKKISPSVKPTKKQNLASIKYEPVPSSDKVSQQFKASKKGWLTYENYLGGYAIDYPDRLKLYESNIKTSNGEFGEGYLCLAITETEVGDDYRDCSGLLILYSTPYIIGKGGMGCGDDLTEINLRDRTMNICLNNERIGDAGLYYASHPAKKSEVGFRATFNTKLSKNDVLEILKTFRFIP